MTESLTRDQLTLKCDPLAIDVEAKSSNATSPYHQMERENAVAV